MIGKLAISGLERTSGVYSRENLLTVYFQSGTFKFDALTSGPYVNASSSSCNLGLRQVWIASVSDQMELIDQHIVSVWLLTSGTVQFQSRRYSNAGLDRHNTYTDLFGPLGIENIRPGFFFSVCTEIGLILTLCIPLSSYGIPTKISCAALPWIGHVAFAVTYAPLFAKTYRISIIFNNPKMRKVSMTDKAVAKLAGLILLLFIILLTTWSLAGLPTVQADYFSDGVRYEQCHNPTPWFSWIFILLEALLLSWGSLLCYRVHEIDGEFAYLNESKSIGMSIYNAVFFGILLMLLSTVLDVQPNMYYVIASIILILNAVFASFVLHVRTLMNTNEPSSKVAISNSAAKYNSTGGTSSPK